MFRRRALVAVLSTFFALFVVGADSRCAALAQSDSSADLAARLPFAKDWREAAQLAQSRRQFVLAIVQLYPGLTVQSDAAVSCLLAPELVDLIRERFVPLRVGKPGDVPFSAPGRYRIGPNGFGVSALVVTPEGDVVADTFLVSNAEEWFDEFLRGVLVERGEDTFDATTIADPFARAQRLERRGELDAALEAAAKVETLPAALLRIRVARRERNLELARAELARADELVTRARSPTAPNDAKPSVELTSSRVDLEVERAHTAMAAGDFEGARTGLESAVALAPTGPRAAETRTALALLCWDRRDYAGARERLLAVAHDFPKSSWATSATQMVADPNFELGVEYDPRWPNAALLNHLTLALPSPLPPSEAARAEHDALERLLLDQNGDGSWTVGTDLALWRIARADPLRVAVTAFVAQSLVPAHDDRRVAAALERAQRWLLDQLALVRARPTKREAMDYWPWADGYLLGFFADEVGAGVATAAALGDAPKQVVDDLVARQAQGGGWSYLVSTDLTKGADAPPIAVSMSFTTGALLDALERAAAVGFAVPPKLRDDALDCLARTDVKGSFEYALASDSRALTSSARVGAAGRDPFLAHLLARAGRGNASEVGEALDRFVANVPDLTREVGKSLMHCGPEGLGSHYVLFDDANTARVVAESATSVAAPKRDAARLAVLQSVLAARLADGSFVDNPLIGRAYGTAAALQALRLLRESKTSRAPAGAAATSPSPTKVAFERVVLEEHVGIGYGVAVADVDGDGHRDVVVVDQHEVRWHRAPKWDEHVLVGKLCDLDHVCVAARDGVASIAIGGGWNPSDTTTSSPSFLLSPVKDEPLAPWTPQRLEGEPTLHRMKWVVNRRGDARLVELALHGRGDVDAKGEGVRLVEVRRDHDDATKWTSEPVATPLHQTHDLDVVEWDGDADEELLVAAREGLFLFDRNHRKDAKNAATRQERDAATPSHDTPWKEWTWTELVGPTTGHPEFRGASEVRLGRFANGRRFLAAVEPFHGNALVVYGEPQHVGEPWSRRVLDESMNDAHALACGDLLGRGDDQIVVGWRKPDANGKTGLRIFVAQYDAASRATAAGSATGTEVPPFTATTIDDHTACEDLALADVDEDGRIDVVASGRDSHDLVLLLNRMERADARGSAPPRAPLDVTALAAIDDVVAEAIANHQLPGCVVAIGRSDGLRFLRAYGERSLVPTREPMTLDTLFDLASLTKPIATATSVMALVDDGKVALDDRLSKHLPEHTGNATIRQCLEHTAGFVPDDDLSDYDRGAGEAWTKLVASKPASEPGARFVYSDVGYELLGRMVERVSGKSLADFARERIFAPLAMTETTFLPDEKLRARAAPTEPRDGAMLRGVVHDPRAAKLGGVAGHAGLFSTALDLTRFARAMLNRGELDGARVLSPNATTSLTSADALPGGQLRTPGFDAHSKYSGNRGDGMSSRAFGHGGFTGTGLWIDPGLDLFVLFLGNRVHPDGKGAVNPLIGRIGTIAAAAVGRALEHEAVETHQESASKPATSSPLSVRVGVDVLREEKFERLRGRHVGLITNASGKSFDGTSTVALLTSEAARAADVKLVAIFTPEHGLDGLQDAAVNDGVETNSHCPIHSLYGEQTKPTDAMLAGVDTLLFDVQDAGVRCYTYGATMILCMQAAAERGLRFVVLDRPDPIGGEVVAGPLPDSGRESFTCFHPVPLRHGMTLGELARMFVAERGLNLDLDVVAMTGWRRNELFDDTRVPWTNPSPNLRSLDEELAYPGLVLFETTNLSVGRGTDTPFEQLGAPWLDAKAIVAALETNAARSDATAGRAAAVTGVRLTAVDFTPTSSKFAGELCHGLRLTIADRRAFDPTRLALELAAALVARHPKEFELERMDGLSCSKTTIAALRAGTPAAVVAARWEHDAAAFRERRAPFLLYR